MLNSITVLIDLWSNGKSSSQTGRLSLLCISQTQIFLCSLNCTLSTLHWDVFPPLLRPEQWWPGSDPPVASLWSLWLFSPMLPFDAGCSLIACRNVLTQFGCWLSSDCWHIRIEESGATWSELRLFFADEDAAAVHASRLRFLDFPILKMCWLFWCSSLFVVVN